MLLSKIKGKHIYGLTIDENKSIEILLYSNRLTFMDGSHEIETIEFDEYIEVEATSEKEAEQLALKEAEKIEFIGDEYFDEYAVDTVMRIDD